MYTQSETLVDTAELNRDFIANCCGDMRIPIQPELALMINPGIELRSQKGQVLRVKSVSEKQGQS